MAMEAKMEHTAIKVLDMEQIGEPVLGKASTLLEGMAMARNLRKDTPKRRLVSEWLQDF